MRARKKKSSRKVLLAVPVAWAVLTTAQVVSADDGGDAGADSGTYQRQPGACSVAGEADPFGNHFGAGCC